MKPNNKGTARLFQNTYLERLTRTHIAVPVSLFIIIAIALTAYGFKHGFLNVLSAIGLFLAGWFIWTFLEYIAHRHVFHLHPDTEIKKSIQYTVHGNHHEYPKDKDRLAMPPILSLLLGTMFFFIFKLIFGQFVFGIVSGLLFGYAIYLFIHYAVHAYAPPKNFLKYLWFHHSIHHYKEDDRAFGVTTPFWDWVFRTMPERKR